MSIYEIILAGVLGTVAGVINTLAGNGSAITLAFLIEIMGMPAGLANGTNRIGVIAQSFTSTRVFYKKGLLDISRDKYVIGTVVLGAIFGTTTAISISNESFLFIYKWLLVLLLITLFINPKEWTKTESQLSRLPKPVVFSGLLVLGFYAGFIQMGMGIFLLALLVLGERMDLFRANILKSLIVLVLTIFTLTIFHFSGLVDWKIGAMLGLGQALGAYITSKYFIHLPKANVWTFRLMVVLIVAAIFKSFVL